jgi:hypothetical protein
MEFPYWWDRDSFFQKFVDRKIDTGNPFYVEYGLLLTGGEARQWDKQCREAFTGQAGNLKPHITGAMDRFETTLKMASWVIVESFEWESGLD